MTTTITAINTRKDCYALVNALEKFAKRSKAISDVKANYYCEFVRIDLRVTKTTGKVYKEMVEMLNSVLPYSDSDKGEWASDWWHSYDDTLMNPYTEGKWEVELCVRHW